MLAILILSSYLLISDELRDFKENFGFCFWIKISLDDEKWLNDMLGNLSVLIGGGISTVFDCSKHTWAGLTPELINRIFIFLAFDLKLARWETCRSGFSPSFEYDLKCQVKDVDFLFCCWNLLIITKYHVYKTKRYPL